MTRLDEGVGVVNGNDAWVGSADPQALLISSFMLGGACAAVARPRPGSPTNNDRNVRLISWLRTGSDYSGPPISLWLR